MNSKTYSNNKGFFGSLLAILKGYRVPILTNNYNSARISEYMNNKIGNVKDDIAMEFKELADEAIKKANINTLNDLIENEWGSFKILVRKALAEEFGAVLEKNLKSMPDELLSFWGVKQK